MLRPGSNLFGALRTAAEQDLASGQTPCCSTDLAGDAWALLRFRLPE